MEIDEAKELIIREALRRLGPKACMDVILLQEQITEVVKELGEAIWAHLSDAARDQLRSEGLRMNERTARLKHVSEAIEYGGSLIARYGIETLGELPQEEQQEFARLWSNATGGSKLNDN